MFGATNFPLLSASLEVDKRATNKIVDDAVSPILSGNANKHVGKRIHRNHRKRHLVLLDESMKRYGWVSGGSGGDKQDMLDTIDEKKKENRLLRETITRLEADCPPDQKKSLDDMKNRVAEQDKEIEELKLKLVGIDNLSTTLQENQVKISALEAKDSEYKRVNAELSDVVQEKERLLENSTEELANSKKALEDYKKDNKPENVAKLEESLAALKEKQKEITSLTEENQKLSSKLEATDSENSGNSGKIQQLTKENSEIKERESGLLVEMEAKLAEITVIESELSQLKTKYGILEASNNKCIEEKAVLETANGELEIQRQACIGEKEGLEASNSKCIEAKAVLETEKGELESQKQACIGEKEELMTQNDELEIQNGVLDIEKGLLGIKIDKLEGEKSELETLVEECAEDKSRIIRENSQETKEITKEFQDYMKQRKREESERDIMVEIKSTEILHDEMVKLNEAISFVKNAASKNPSHKQLIDAFIPYFRIGPKDERKVSLPKFGEIHEEDIKHMNETTFSGKADNVYIFSDGTRHEINTDSNRVYQKWDWVAKMSLDIFKKGSQRTEVDGMRNKILLFLYLIYRDGLYNNEGLLVIPNDIRLRTPPGTPKGSPRGSPRRPPLNIDSSRSTASSERTLSPSSPRRKRGFNDSFQLGELFMWY